jgi:competence/damage-inducible protein CinA-like protein
MPIAEILTIGTELLLGEIVDTNSQYLARQLRDAGIDLLWASTVGDNEARIAEAVQRGLSRSDIILCTGGLGPTIDDMTREAIASALGIELEYHEDLWKQIQERFARVKRTASENNKRQAYVPRGARVLENGVGSAPAFLIETNGKVIISMPGVPSEMQYIMEHGVLPYFKERFGNSGIIRARVLHVAGVPESQIDEKIADLEKLSNPTVGLAAHAGAVDVRLTAKANDEKGIEVMLADLEREVRTRLGDWIYGVDEESLARAVLKIVAARKQTLAVIEKGLKGALVKALTGEGNAFVGGEILDASLKTSPLKEIVPEYAKNVHADVVLGVVLQGENDKNELEIAIHGLGRDHHYEFSYGGHTSQAPEWATNMALSTLRRQLIGKER